MNKNFLNNCFPPISLAPTHILAEDSIAVLTDYNGFAPKGKITDKTNTLKKGTEVILLDYGLGYKGSWSRIIIVEAQQKNIFFVESIVLKPFKEIKEKFRGIEKYPSYTVFLG